MRRHTLWIALWVSLVLSATGRPGLALEINTVDLDNGDQVVAHLQEKIDDDEAIIAFYQKVDSWDRMRELRRFDIPSNIREHNREAETDIPAVGVADATV